MDAKKIFLSSVILFLLLILGTVMVNAKEDFTASAKRSVELCPCSNQGYSVIVQNTGTFVNSYSVSASGPAAEWVTFNPGNFILNPGQKGSFLVIVNSVCNIEGAFDFDIFITTNNGLTKSIGQVVQLSQCYDYSLDQGRVVEEVEERISFLEHGTSYTLCTNEQKSIPVLISNNENFGNKYKLFMDAPEWAELNTRSVSLGAKKSGIFLINFDTIDIEGEFDIKFTSISELGNVQRKKNIEIDVLDCYALELELKEEDEVCGGEEKSFDIVINNPVDFKKDVIFEIEGPEWADLGNTSIVFSPGQTKTTIMTVNPGDDVSGSFLVKINAIVEDEIRSSDDLKLEVITKEACYNADISTKTSITNFYSHEFFSVKVTNTGIKEAVYDVSLEGPGWVSIDPEFLELNPGQTGNLNLKVSPSEEIEEGTYGLIINLESNDVIYSKNVDISLRKENEVTKKLKSILKNYQYYIYVLIVIVILIVVFTKPIIKIKNNTKKRYETYKLKKEKLKALKLVRLEKEEEKRKKKELEEIRREKEKTRINGKKKKSKKNIFKFPLSKILIYVGLLIASIIYIGHENKLFNAKYLHIYIRNLFYGYQYYILIGVGTVIILFLLLLLYNFISAKRKGKKKIKKTEKTEKKTKKENEWYNKPSYVIAVFIPIMILLAALAYFNLFDDIKDFVVLYSSYFGSGIVILVLLIMGIRFYKPLFKFLKE